MLTKLRTLVLVLGATFAVSASQAHAVTYNFANISNNSGNAGAVAPQLSVDVTAGGLVGGFSTVLFTFYNVVGIDSSITDIYFDDTPTPLFADVPPPGPTNNVVQITASSGVSFSQPATPGNLPEGNTLSPGFVATASANSDSPGVSGNGVNSSSEWVGLYLRLAGSNTLAQVLAALNAGTFRIGLHVQSISPSNLSDAFVNTVPIPPAIVFFLTGLAGLGWLGRRRIRARSI
jgi:hypothetical protein